MRPFPKLRPTAWDGLVALCVAALALGIAFFQWRGGTSEALTAVVSVDGMEVDRLDLEHWEEPRAYTNNGYTLTLSWIRHNDAENGVWVAESDCPTQDCVRTGAIFRPGQSIVCLPARIIIRLEGGTPEDGGVDAILG